MSFRDFDLPKVQRDFGLKVDSTQDLFATIAPVALNPEFLKVLEESAPLALLTNTEKGRSEWMVAPLLAQLWIRCRNRIAVFSGHSLDVDPAAGLNGTCDFIICHSPQLLYVAAPVVVVAEAKRDNPAEGYGQCAAGMVAAQRFNEREKNGIESIYGVSTSGTIWRFLQLRGQLLSVDAAEYTLPQVDRILGILMHMVEPVTQPAIAA